MSARIHPHVKEERSEDVMSNLLLASVNSATFSRTSSLNHSSARYERRKSLEQINRDPVWDLKDQGNFNDVKDLLSEEDEFSCNNGELLDNEDSDLAGLNKEQQYIALNASPLKNKKFIKTLDSKRLHQDRIRRNSNEESAMEEKKVATEATEMKSEPLSSATSTPIETEKNKMEDVKEGGKDECAVIEGEKSNGEDVEEEKIVVKEKETQEGGQDEKEKDVAVVETLEKQDNEKKEDTVIVMTSSSNDENDIINRGSTGHLEI